MVRFSHILFDSNSKNGGALAAVELAERAAHVLQALHVARPTLRLLVDELRAGDLALFLPRLVGGGSGSDAVYEALTLR